MLLDGIGTSVEVDFWILAALLVLDNLLLPTWRIKPETW